MQVYNCVKSCVSLKLHKQERDQWLPANTLRVVLEELHFKKNSLFYKRNKIHYAKENEAE